MAHDPYTYTVLDARTGETVAQKVSNVRASELTDLFPEDIAWATEEHGVAETDEHIVFRYQDKHVVSHAIPRDDERIWPELRGGAAVAYMVFDQQPAKQGLPPSFSYRLFL